jgi:hypothetical protein
MDNIRSGEMKVYQNAPGLIPECTGEILAKKAVEESCLSLP